MTLPRRAPLCALLLALGLGLPALAGCGKRDRPADPLPRRMMAERGAVRYAADRQLLRMHAPGVVTSLGERDRYIVTKANLIDYLSRGGRPEVFFRSLAIEPPDWKFLDDFYWMDPTVRKAVEEELKRPGTVAPGLPAGVKR